MKNCRPLKCEDFHTHICQLIGYNASNKVPEIISEILTGMSLYNIDISWREFRFKKRFIIKYLNFKLQF